MKCVVTKLGFLTIVTLISALPAAADTGMGMSGGDHQKDQCLLVSRTCRDSVDSLQQRIDRLHREIGKGTNVYTKEELRNLEFQLRDAIQTMEVLTRGGA